jgi:hypothetical protein
MILAERSESTAAAVGGVHAKNEAPVSRKQLSVAQKASPQVPTLSAVRLAVANQKGAPHKEIKHSVYHFHTTFPYHFKNNQKTAKYRYDTGKSPSLVRCVNWLAS